MNVAITRTEGIGAETVADVVGRSPISDVADAERTLIGFICSSDSTWIGSVDGQVACIWGLMEPSILSDRAYLWLLTTDVVDEHKFLLVRHSQRWIEDMLRTYSAIIGDVHVEDLRAIRWIKWLGATFGEPNGLRIPFQIKARKWPIQ